MSLRGTLLGLVILSAPLSLADAQTGLVTGLVVVAEAGQLSLSWQDNSTDETSFLIERSLPGDVCTFSPVGTAPMDAETFIDTPLVEGNRWCYRVLAINALAVNGFEVSAPSNVACGTVPVIPPPPPPSVSMTFVKTSSTQLTPYDVPIDVYTCRRIHGGTSQLQILRNTTILRTFNLPNPAYNVPFTITCELSATMVTFKLDGVIKLSVPR